MTQNQILLSSLSSDLYRVALAAHKKTPAMKMRFIKETSRWLNDIDDTELKPYIQKVLAKIKQIEAIESDELLADQCLVYSILLKNYVIHNINVV
jgi:hypothetical protein